jgi:ABC-type transport system substrate-binding protein
MLLKFMAFLPFRMLLPDSLVFGRAARAHHSRFDPVERGAACMLGTHRSPTCCPGDDPPGAMQGTRTAMRVSVLLAALAVVASCAPLETSPTASPSPAAPSAPAGRPIVVQVYEIPTMSNYGRIYAGGVIPYQVISRMVQAALFRYDASLAAVPDLAAEPCAVAADLVTITCSLRTATFHDGSSVTAQDVAYTYELANSPECPFNSCLAGRLRAVEAVDPKTVRFVLEQPYAPFLSSAVADVFIEPRAEIERSYQAFAAKARQRDPAALDALAGRIRQGLESASPDCTSSVAEGETTLKDLGVTPADRRLFGVFGGRGLDDCSYADYLAASLEQAARSMRAEGMDAVAAAYPILAFNSFAEMPIGAGPWRIGQLDPEKGVVLERNDAYHHGVPLTPEIRIQVIQDWEEIRSAMVEGRIDWLPGEALPGQYAPLRGESSVRLTEYPTFTYVALQYNVRPGQLFSDRNLRQAVELCIDKERIEEAALPGATAIYSPIPPASWAYQPGLAKPRDVEAARRLIEASGWSAGEDGIYERGGSRLSFEVVVRADIEPAVAVLDRASARLRDCGIEMAPRPVDFQDALAMIFTFPHLTPGSSKPFEAYLGGWGMAFDPDVSELFHSSHITTETQTGPPNYNYIGFSDPRVDDLLDRGLATYGQAERTEIYRELQRVLAEEQPYLFIAAIGTQEALDADLTSSTGQLDLRSPTWWWQLEALVNPAE